MFGQNKSTFGGFGAPASTGFGATGTSGFGAATPTASSALGGFGANKPGGLFAAKPSTTAANPFGGFGTTGATGGLFGQPATTASSSLFGRSVNQTTSGSLFSTPAVSAATGAFGQTAFGATPSASTGFGGGGLFGATAGQGVAGSTSAFGSSLGAFGAATAAAMVGTTKKYEPTAGGADSMVKSGTTVSVQTKYQSITAMKDYEGKSFEELRAEDYAAGRKTGGSGLTAAAPGAGGMFAQPAASTVSAFGSLTAAATPAASGATPFGQTAATGFGSTAGSSLFATSSSTASNLFGAKPVATSTLFGAPAQSTATGFGQTPSLFGQTSTGSTSLFGQSAAKPGGLFGTAAAQPSLFGQTPAAGTGFGQTSVAPGFLGQTAATSAAPAFGFGTAATSQPGLTGFGFGNTATSTGGLFGAAKPVGLSLGSGFGAATTTTASTGFSFGAGTGLGSGLGTGLGSTLGAGAAKPAFGFGSLGATNTSSNMFQLGGGMGLSTAPTAHSQMGANTFLTSASMPSGQDAATQLRIRQQQVLALSASPYGDSDLFKNLKERPRTDIKPTDAAAQKALIDSAKLRMSSCSGGTPKLKTHPVYPLSGKTRKGNLSGIFDGLEDEESSAFLNQSFVPRRSIKKLIIQDQSAFEVSQSQRGVRLSDSQSDRGMSTPKARGVGSSMNNTELRPPQYDKLDLGSPASRGCSHGDITVGSAPGVAHKRADRGRELSTFAETPGSDRPPHVGPLQLATLLVDTPLAGVAQKRRGTASTDDNGCIQDDEVSSTPHPAGITLRRPDYYTIPVLSTLTPGSDGTCLVEHLTIGRHEYGSVFFPGVTDVFGLNLDEIVFIARKEVTIYPDEETKPPLGTGLNKGAIVTLQCVWPRDKTTHEPIKSPERLKLMSYASIVETATSRIGARFLDYRPETGAWVFEVDHFSRYRLVEGDEDDGEVQFKDVRPTEVKDPHTAGVKGDPQPVGDKGVPVRNEGLTAQTQDLLTQVEEVDPEVEGQQAEGRDLQEAGRVNRVDHGGEDEEDSTEADYREVRGLGGDRMDDDILEEGGEDVMVNGVYPGAVASSLPAHLAVNHTAIQRMKASFHMEEEEEEEEGVSTTDVMRRFPAAMTLSGHKKGKLTMDRNSSNFKAFSSKRVSMATTPRPAMTSEYPLLSTSMKETSMSSRLQTPSYGVLDPDWVEEAPVCSAPLLAPPAHLSLTESLLSPSSSIHGDSAVGGGRCPLLDAAVMRGKSCRVGWGPGLTMVHGTTHLPANGGGSDADGLRKAECLSRCTVAIESVQDVSAIANLSTRTQAGLVSALQLSLKHSKRIGAESEQEVDYESPLVGPGFAPERGYERLEALCAASRECDEEEGGSSMEVHREDAVIWELCNALWGNEEEAIRRYTMTGAVEDDLYIRNLVKSQAFSSWLRFAATAASKSDCEQADRKGSDPAELIYSHLTGNNTGDAARAALQGHDLRLSLLLSQGTSDNVRNFLQAQLDGWAETGADQYISPYRLKVYCVCAGLMRWETSDGCVVNPCDGLDWKRCMGLYRWYESPINTPVHGIMERYHTALTEEPGLVATPVPPYGSQYDGMNQSDVCYLLLRYYSGQHQPVEQLLAPQTITEQRLDYHLSWHLWCVLESVGALSRGLTQTTSHHLHSSYSAQLESIGLWPWAVYVLTHLPAHQRKAAILPVLMRNMHRHSYKEEMRPHFGESYCRQDVRSPAGVEDIDEFLLVELGIPAEWLHEAKALSLSQNRYSSQPIEEFFHLVSSKQFPSAHSVLLLTIAPHLVINDRVNELKDLVEMLEPHSSMIHQWTIGGLIYSDFLKLLDPVSDLKEGRTSLVDVEVTFQEVVSLSSRLSSLQCPSPQHRLCQAEMARQVAALIKALLRLQRGTAVKSHSDLISSRFAGPLLSQLCLPEDHALSELRELARSYSMEFS